MFLIKCEVGCEGLELHILHRPHMDSIDLDPQPILGIGSDICYILNRFRMDLGSIFSRLLNGLAIHIGTRLNIPCWAGFPCNFGFDQSSIFRNFLGGYV